MKRKYLLLVGLVAVMTLIGCQGEGSKQTYGPSIDEAATKAPQKTVTPVPTPTPLPTVTPTNSPTPTNTATPTNSPTPTNTPTP